MGHLTDVKGIGVTDSMKAYLFTTGALFALLAVAHVLRTIAEWSRVAADPWFILEGPGIGLLAAADRKSTRLNSSH